MANMKKLSEADKRQITIEYAAGAKTTELAAKFHVSHTAISKILSKKEVASKLQEVSGKVQEAINAPYKEKAHAVIKSIIDDLPNDLKKASVKDKMIVLEKMITYYGVPEEEKEQVNEIVVKIVDGSVTDD